MLALPKYLCMCIIRQFVNTSITSLRQGEEEEEVDNDPDVDDAFGIDGVPLPEAPSPSLATCEETADAVDAPLLDTAVDLKVAVAEPLSDESSETKPLQLPPPLFDPAMADTLVVESPGRVWDQDSQPPPFLDTQTPSPLQSAGSMKALKPSEDLEDLDAKIAALETPSCTGPNRLVFL